MRQTRCERFRLNTTSCLGPRLGSSDGLRCCEEKTSKRRATPSEAADQSQAGGQQHGGTRLGHIRNREIDRETITDDVPRQKQVERQVDEPIAAWTEGAKIKHLIVEIGERAVSGACDCFWGAGSRPLALPFALSKFHLVADL